MKKSFVKVDESWYKYKQCEVTPRYSKSIEKR